MTNIIPPEFKSLQTVYQYQDDEISLIDLWVILVKRKYLIFGIFMAVLVAAAAYVYSVSPVFESRVVIQIGHVGKIGLLEPPKVLVQRLIEEYRVGDTTEGRRSYPLVKSIGLEKGLEDIIAITTQGHSATEAQSFLTEVTSKLLSDHKALFVEAQKQQQIILQSLDREVQETKDQMSALSQQLQTVMKSNPTTAAILTQDKANLALGIPKLEQQRSELKLAMSELQTIPTRILRSPTIPINPIKPKPLLYLLLASILGLVIGVFAVFIGEFLAKVREKLKETSLSN